MVDAILKLINPLIEELGSSIEENIIYPIKNNLLEYELEEYNRNLFIKTFIHRTIPTNIYKIYQPLSIKNEETGKSYKIDSLNLFLERQFVTVIGEAGSGKSTMIKYFIVKAIDEKIGIPVKVELRYLNNYKGTVLEYIYDKIFKMRRISDNENIIGKLLLSGKFILFFDGFDELDSSQIEVRIKEIDEITSTYSKNKFIVTSRPHTAVEMLPIYHNYEVLGLTQIDIKEFINRQFEGVEKISLQDNLLNNIEKGYYAEQVEYLSNPLLLSMFILTYQNNSSVPLIKSEFYKQVFDTLYTIHDSLSKLGYEREKKSGMSRKGFTDFLEIFSFLSFFEEYFTFSKEYIETIFEKIKNRRNQLNGEFQDVIYDLVVSICIFRVEGKFYVFPHRSLQEYFCANYISKMHHENKKRVYFKIAKNYLISKGIDEESEQSSLEVDKSPKEYIFSMKGTLSDKTNFLDLLKEMDERYFAEYFAIPVITKFIDVLSEKIDVNDWFKLSRSIPIIASNEVVDLLSFESEKRNITIKIYQKVC